MDLSNQYRILEHIDEKNAEAYRHAHEALTNGYELYYGWLCEHVADGANALTEAECTYVLDVLDMFDFMQRAYDKPTDKSGIDATLIFFPGFDGNNEGKYWDLRNSFAGNAVHTKIFVNTGKTFNSHMPTHDLYERMLNAWAMTMTSEDSLRMISSASRRLLFTLTIETYTFNSN